MRKLFLSVLLVLMVVSLNDTLAQKTKWLVGGKLGMMIVSATGGSSTGLQIGPMAEVLFGKNLAVGSEFTINTQGGTPIGWVNYFKYYFDVRGSKIKPYGYGGLALWFFTGGPYFGVHFGGGANFPIAKKLYIPAEIQLGPVFAKGNTVFDIAITSGIRYLL